VLRSSGEESKASRRTAVDHARPVERLEGRGEFQERFEEKLSVDRKGESSRVRDLSERGKERARGNNPPRLKSGERI